MENDKAFMNLPVDVICYGERKHFDTRKKAIEFFLEGMAFSEGSERERYSTIYLELLTSDSPIVSDGEPALVNVKVESKVKDLDSVISSADKIKAEQKNKAIETVDREER